MIHSPDTIATWARATLAAMEPGEAVARVRLRLLPSPLGRGDTISVPWEGHRTPDALGDQVVLRLAGHELPASVRVRLDCLDGAGDPIRGATASRTFHAPAHPEPAPMPANPPPRAAEAPATLVEGLLDLDELAAAETGLRAAQAWGGLPARGAAAAESDASGRDALQTITLHALGQALDLQHRTSRVLLARAALDGQTIRELTDQVRRGGAARDGLLEEVLPAMIEAVRAAAESRAEAQVATVEAERTVALAEAGAEQTPAQQAIAVLHEAGQLLAGAKIRRGPAAAPVSPPPPAAPVDGAGPVAEKSPTPAAATPPTSDGEIAEQLGRVLRGELPAALAGRVLVSRLGPSERAQAEALARAILAAGGPSSTPEAA